MNKKHSQVRFTYKQGNWFPVVYVGEMRWQLDPRPTKRDAREAGKAFIRAMPR